MPHQCTTCSRAFEDGSKEMLSGCPDCGGNKFQFIPEDAVDGNAGGATGAATAATAPKKKPDVAQSSMADRSQSGTGDHAEPKSKTRSDDSTGGSGQASAVNRAAATVRDWVGRGEDDSPDGPSRTDSSTAETQTETVTQSENSAQASARRDVVSKSELPDDPPESSSARDSPVSDPPASDSPASDSPASDSPASDSPASDSPASPKADEESNVVDAPADEDPGLAELREELNSQFESIRIEEPGQYELNLMELYEREEYIISLQEDGKYVIEVPDAWEETER